MSISHLQNATGLMHARSNHSSQNNEDPSSKAHTGTSQPGTRVQIRGLGKAYGKRQVLNDIDLQIEPGEFVAIVGRSGCGKSTLLRLLAGLERSTVGQIELDRAPLRPDAVAEQGLRLAVKSIEIFNV